MQLLSCLGTRPVSLQSPLAKAGFCVSIVLSPRIPVAVLLSYSCPYLVAHAAGGRPYKAFLTALAEHLPVLPSLLLQFTRRLANATSRLSPD